MKFTHHPAKQTKGKQARGRALRLGRFLRESKAVSALEYAILVGVIAIGIGTALTAFSGQITAALAKGGAKLATIAGLN